MHNKKIYLTLNAKGDLHLDNKREHWSSSFGFIMAAASAAIGLGNLWKFPYVVGMNGGALFLIVYLVLMFFIGVPILISEMALGRHTQLNAVGAYKKISKKWEFVGALGIICAFVILAYYSVVGGWVIKYIYSYFIGANLSSPSDFFNIFVAKQYEPIIWQFGFIAASAVIVMAGISNGIEKISKILLPTLIILIIVVMIKALTLPNAIKGVKFFIVPNFNDIKSFGDVGRIFLTAMGQVFFSLSLGMGAIITYGSYLGKGTNIQKDGIIIPLLDSAIAVLAGFTILPAVFSFGFAPQAGPGLIFQTLPAVFNHMVGGRLLGLVFFLIVFFAAITSAISLLEVIASYLIDTFRWSRLTSTILPSVLIFVVGSFASLSFGPLKHMLIFNMSFFDFCTFITDKLLMPIGGFLLCVFVGYIWGIRNVTEELSNKGTVSFKLRGVYSIIIKYVAPVAILIIFITSLFE